MKEENTWDRRRALRVDLTIFRARCMKLHIANTERNHIYEGKCGLSYHKKYKQNYMDQPSEKMRMLNSVSEPAQSLHVAMDYEFLWTKS